MENKTKEKYNVGDEGIFIIQEVIESPENMLNKKVTGHLLDKDDELVDLPEFIEFNSDTYSYFVESYSNIDAGNYTLVTMIIYSDYPGVWRMCNRTLEVNETITPPVVTNEKPYFEKFEDFLLTSAVCDMRWT